MTTVLKFDASRIWIVCFITAGLIACGDEGDDLAGNYAADGGLLDAGNGSTAATAGAGAAGTGELSDLDAGADLNDGGTFPVVECGSAAVITSCGSQQCPDPDPFAAQSCRATCCTSDNVCGLLDASGQICVAPSFAAGGCPKVSVSLGGVSARLAGCCAASGSCGAVAFGECVEPAKLGIGEASCPGGDDAGVL